MKRVVKIADVLLDNPLFIEDEFAIKNTQAVTFKTLSGGTVVYESIKRNNANYITLTSDDNGWQRYETINNILLLLDDLGFTFPILLEDGATVKCRLAIEHEKAIQATKLYEGSKWYKVKIFLARVE